MAKAQSQIELETQVKLHAQRLEAIDKVAGKAADVADIVRRESEGEIKALKAEVATLKQITYGALLMAFGALLAAVLKK